MSVLGRGRARLAVEVACTLDMKWGCVQALVLRSGRWGGGVRAASMPAIWGAATRPAAGCALFRACSRLRDTLFGVLHASAAAKSVLTTTLLGLNASFPPPPKKRRSCFPRNFPMPFFFHGKPAPVIHLVRGWRLGAASGGLFVSVQRRDARCAASSAPPFCSGEGPAGEP